MTAQTGNAFIKTAPSVFPNKTRVYLWRVLFPAIPVSTNRMVFVRYAPLPQRPSYNPRWVFQVPQGAQVAVNSANLPFMWAG